MDAMLRNWLLSWGIFLSLFWTCAPTLAQSDQLPKLTRLGNFKSDAITESSGLAWATHPKAFWTVNDSGNRPELYLVATDGELLTTVSLKNATNVDWESMSRVEHEGKSFLIIGDVGDNVGNRKHVSLYVVEEPVIGAGENKIAKEAVSEAIRIDFVYSDGPRNCEAIAVDTHEKVIWLIEKLAPEQGNEAQAGIYKLPLVTTPQSKWLTAERVGAYPIRNVTGMDISPDGKRAIVRTYLNAHCFSVGNRDRKSDPLFQGTPVRIPLPVQIQGEAICFESDGRSVILTSEWKSQAIWKLDISAHFLESNEKSK